MAIDDVYRLVIKGRQGLSIRVNDLAVKLQVAAPSPAAQQTLADDFKAVWQPGQHNSAVWETWELRQLWGAGMTTVDAECRRDGGLVFGGPLSAPLNGAVSSNEALPPQNSVVVTLVTGTIGRRRRGRWYGWGWDEGIQDAGLLNSTFFTAQGGRVATFINKYKQGGTSTDFVLGIWSERTASGCKPNASTGKIENVDPVNPDGAFTSVLSSTLRNVVYTQRRRTLGHGA